jgi:hypothetical protein
MQIDNLLVRIGNRNNVPRFPVRNLVTKLTELPRLENKYLSLSFDISVVFFIVISILVTPGLNCIELIICKNTRDNIISTGDAIMPKHASKMKQDK